MRTNITKSKIIAALVVITTAFQFSAPAANSEDDGGTAALTVGPNSANSLPPSGSFYYSHDGYAKIHLLAPRRHKTITATVTAYNSVESQTDKTPCFAGRVYICGRNDVVACPRIYRLGTRVNIGDVPYTCVDRLSKKYDSRFDIFMGGDVDAALRFGKQQLEITIYE